MAYNASASIDKALEKALSMVEEFVLAENMLPWNSPYFRSFFEGFVNPLKKTDFAGKPYPNGRPYRGGINSLLLMMAAQSAQRRNSSERFDHRFVPRSAVFSGQYKVHKNASVKKGAKMISIFYPIFKKNKDFNPSIPCGNGNEKDFFGGFGSGQVISVLDTNLEELGVIPPLPEIEKRENPPVEELERLLRAYPQDFGHLDGVPHYNLLSKAIRIPRLEQFVDSISYYGTWIHELSHQIGDMIGEVETGSMRSDSYSKEELRAELTKVFVLGRLGFNDTGIDDEKNSAVYVATWLKRIKTDISILRDAAMGAQRRGSLIIETRLPAAIKDRELFTFLPAESEEVAVETMDTEIDEIEA